MCGIAGVASLTGNPVPELEQRLKVMSELQRHRGPDGSGSWVHPRSRVGFAHRRLAIIDLETGAQPMTDGFGNWISFNGEIYNYIELRDQLGKENFKTHSDTEVILLAYRKWGTDCLQYLRGMFSFVLWDETNQVLLCARDRFGIKPLYYSIVAGTVYIASEAKALLPFLASIETDIEGLNDYLVFQLCLKGKTLFKDVNELEPGHMLRVENGSVTIARYWEVYYDLDTEHTERYFVRRIQDLFDESVRLHLRSDVSVGAYLSGGFDSSLLAALASEQVGGEMLAFTGKFSIDAKYDESRYAEALAEDRKIQLHQRDIGWSNFEENIRKVIYHLDYPVAGPGSFPQFMISQLAAQHRKVVIGGQGGDEIFGGYVRYLIAYFEQCIKGAIDGTMDNGNFVVSYRSIIPNLTALRNYKPLLENFWRQGLFEDLDRRYFRLVSRSSALSEEINWEALGGYDPFETFRSIFRASNVGHESYFDLMTHFDFKTLLPGLLQVEDRMSMAHGLESRVPFLDHPLVELAATIPSNIKFQNGALKNILRKAMGHHLPDAIMNRTDKMGFPVPLHEWIHDEGYEFFRDIFSTQAARGRTLIDNSKIVEKLKREPSFGRTIWGLFSLELWQQEFHDRGHEYRGLMQ